LLLAAMLGLNACGRKSPVQNRVTDLEKAFSTQEQNVYITAALSAIRSNDYVGAVTILQSVQGMTGVPMPQRMAVREARLAIVTDLTTRADQGDARAKADLAEIERSRSQ